MFYSFFAPLEAFAVPALTSMAGFSDRKASLGASILPALSIILSPPFGAVVDRELGKGVSGRHRSRSTNPPCLQRLWPPGSTQLWAMLLPALGIGAIIVHPSLWALGFGLISLGYALSCASLWIVIPECESAALTEGLVERLHHPVNTNTPSHFTTTILPPPNTNSRRHPLPRPLLRPHPRRRRRGHSRRAGRHRADARPGPHLPREHFAAPPDLCAPGRGGHTGADAPAPPEAGR